ncbi:MAG: glycoside hydrolase family 26 protein [Nocardioides sp.]
MLHRLLGCLLGCLLVVAGTTPAGRAAPPASAPPASATPADTMAAAPSTRAAKSPVIRNRCKRNKRFVPSCGILWGSYLSPTGGVSPYRSLERQVGRRFDIVKAYWGWKPGKVFPTDQQKALAKGRMWQVSWNAIDYDTRRSLRYVDIAAGRYDASIIRPQALALKRWNKRVIIDFDHEMEGSWSQGGVSTNPSNPDVDAREYIAAYRHIVRVFRDVGATKVRFAWVTAGWTPSKFARYYPGPKFVDWVGYDPYNFNTCHGSPWRTPRKTFGPFYRWAMSTPGVRKKPLMVGEYGSHHSARSQRWHGRVARTLRTMPRVKAVMHWGSSLDSCDYRLTTNAGAMAGFRKSGLSRYVLGAANLP